MSKIKNYIDETAASEIYRDQAQKALAEATETGEELRRVLAGEEVSGKYFTPHVTRYIDDVVIATRQAAENVVVSVTAIVGQDEPSAVEPPPQMASLNRMIEWTGYLPMDLRKNIKSCVGDYGADICEYHKAGKHRMAQFNLFLVKVAVIGYCLRWPWDLVRGLMIPPKKGS